MSTTAVDASFCAASIEGWIDSKSEISIVANTVKFPYVWKSPIPVPGKATPTVCAAFLITTAKPHAIALAGVVHEVNLLKKVRLEIAVNEEFVEPTVQAIVKGAKTGKIGDGKIFVMDLHRCIRIRTEEEGSKAIG